MRTDRISFRLGALLAALLLMAASPATALATGSGHDAHSAGGGAAGAVIEEGREGTLTIEAPEGVEFTYHKVSPFETYTRTEIGTDGVVKTVMVPEFAIDDKLRAILNLPEAKGYTGTQLNGALEALYGPEASDRLTGTKDALEAYIQTAAGEAGTTLRADGSGKASAQGLEQGLYLVVETEVPRGVSVTTNPFFVSIPMTNGSGDGWDYDVKVQPKPQTRPEETPTLVKQVRAEGGEAYGATATASSGEGLEYRLISRLPLVSSTATYLTRYEFADEASGGIEYEEDSFEIRFYETKEAAEAAEDGTAIETWTSGDGHFLVSDEASGDGGGAGGKVIRVTEKGLAEMNPKYSGKYMVVDYRARLTEEAVMGDAGNPNRAVLNWLRTNEEEGEEKEKPEDDAVVYTYGIQLNKVFYRGDKIQKIGENGLDASGVRFCLKKGGKYAMATEEEGVYHITGFTEKETEATSFSPKGEDGSLSIRGLGGGDYTLTEMETLPKYALLTGEVSITIRETGREGDVLTEASASVTGLGLSEGTATEMIRYKMGEDEWSEHALVTLEVVNRTLPLLPGTGGIGTVPFMLVGGALILAGLMALWRKRRRE